MKIRLALIKALHLMGSICFTTTLLNAQTKEAIEIPDSISITPAAYYKAGLFKQFFFGSNYRKEWSTPVHVKIFNIGQQFGGLVPTERGGGHQTKSLRLKDTTGKEYVLRSIEKNPELALPEDLRETFIKDVAKDGISASYPFGSLSVPVLSDAAGVLHSTPQLVYLPDDLLLGQFRKDFANGLYLFEEREPVAFGKNYSTLKTYEKLQEDNDNSIDQQSMLRARLLDMFIMDFDRHEDQWRWWVNKSGKGQVYSPIPRDRDQAFFISSGFIPSLVRKPWVAPQLQGFRQQAININTFNFEQRNLDRFFLNELSEDDWRKEATLLIANMTDKVIEKAIQQQPREIYLFSGNKIIAMLKARRNYFLSEAIQYYQFLSEEVTIAGSDKNELFDITRNEDGSVQASVYKISKTGEKTTLLYNRKFLPTETKEIRLFGQGGDDKFVLHGNAITTIKIRIIGGAGSDVFDNSCSSPANKTIVYDLKTEQNQFTGSGTFRNKSSSDTLVNKFNHDAYKYNLFAPLLSAGYNPDDGLYLGLSATVTTHGFRKEPFATTQHLSIVHALSTKSFNIKYGLEATDVIGRLDLLLNADLFSPTVNNFFGLGNETVYAKTEDKNAAYYRSRYREGEINAQLRTIPAKNFTISAGPSFQYYAISVDDNIGRFISTPFLNGLDSTTLYSSKSYAGVQIGFDFDTRNNKILTTKGVNWKTTFNYYSGLNKASNNYSKFNTDLSMYFSLTKTSSIVFATRFGVGINTRSYEFFQAQYLSSTENLRGYRKYRFGGDRMAYNNMELRIKIADFHTYLFPGRLGILLFNDVGRVWVNGEDSKLWHDGYGGGLWISPLKRFVFTGSYANSVEGGTALFSLGFQF